MHLINTEIEYIINIINFKSLLIIGNIFVLLWNYRFVTEFFFIYKYFNERKC